MHRSAIRGLLPLVTVAALLALPACASTVAGTATATSAVVDTAPAPVNTAPVGAAAAPPAATGAPAAENYALAADGLRPFLLAESDLGAGFVSAPEPTPDPAAPAVCGGPGVVARFPEAVRVGVAFERPGGAVRAEEAVSVYPDKATAQAAFDAGAAGLDCGQGTLGGRPVVVTPAEDLRADVGGTQATGRRIGAPGADVVVISVHSDEVVMVFTYVAPEGGSAGLPDPVTVTRGAVQKLVG